MAQITWEPFNPPPADALINVTLTGKLSVTDRLVAVGRNDVTNLAPSIGDASPNRRVEFEIGFNGEAKQ